MSEYIAISSWVHPDIYKQLNEIADAKKMSKSTVIRKIVEKYIAEESGFKLL